MTYLSAILFFMIMLSPLFPPLIMAGADAAGWSYARAQKLIRKQAMPLALVKRDTAIGVPDGWAANGRENKAA